MPLEPLFDLKRAARPDAAVVVPGTDREGVLLGGGDGGAAPRRRVLAW